MNEGLIFDVGAFEGQDTEFYLKKGFSVIAVEANPEFAAVMTDRYNDAIKNGLLTVVCAAVANSEDLTPFFVYEYGQWSSAYKAKGGEPAEIFVKSIQPIELFRTYGVPYYLKVDIEGSDLLLIRALEALGNDAPKFVSFEVGSDAIDGLEILSSLGYKRFKLIEQSAVPSVRLPFPPREGRYVEYQFTHANSGPFGEETLGSWQTAEQIRAAIKNIDWNSTVKVGQEAWNVWYDLHAAL